MPCNLLSSKVGLCGLLGLVLERRPVHPPQKIDPAKVNHVKVKVKGRGFQLFAHLQQLHLLLVSIFTECPSCPMGQTRDLKVSIPCHLMNQRQRKPGLLGSQCFILWGEEVTIATSHSPHTPLGSSNLGAEPADKLLGEMK